MTMEDFRLFHEDNFDSFSKKTIKKASANIRRKLAAQSDRETELSVLPFQDLQKLCTEDTYQEDEESVVFHVQGLSVVVHDSALGQALFSRPSAGTLCCCFTLPSGTSRRSGGCSIWTRPPSTAAAARH